MKYLCNIIFILAVVPFALHAQSNYKPGYIVTLNGDTTKGFIDYKEWSLNPRKFSFKSNTATDKAESKNLSNTLAFGIEGFESYERYVLSISQSKAELSALSTGIDTTYITDTVFLKVIAKGKHITLYSYTDIIKERFFVSEGNAKPIELIYQQYLNPAQTSQILELNSYVRQLQRLTVTYRPNDTKLMQQVLSAAYTDRDLENITLAINGEEQSLAPAGRQSPRFFAGLGLTLSNVDFNGQHISSTASSSSVFPKIGAGVDMYFKRNVRTWLFRTEFSVSGNKTDITFNGEANTPYTQHLKFSQYWAYLNPQLLFNAYNTKKAKIYLAAGVGIAYSIYTDKSNNVDYYLTNTKTVIRSSEEKFPNPQALFFNVTTKLGFVINDKLDIYAGYNLPTSITNYVEYSMNLSSYQIGINLILSKK